MGLLSGIGRKLKDGSLFDGFSAAQAALAGDYQGMAAAHERGDARRINRAKLEMTQNERRTVYTWAKGAGYSEEEAQALANDPNAASALIQARDKPSEFATTGGSRYDPHKNSWIRAPGRDAEGNEYGLSTDPAQAQPVTRRGSKVIPMVPGGFAKAYDALGGQELGASEVRARSGVPPIAGPPASAPRLPAGATDTFRQGIIQQESGGRPGAMGQMTQYGRPMGSTQMLPATAKEMAQKLGLPWRPDLMAGTSPEAAQYQETLGRAYYEQGLQAEGGDPRRAAMYYHGGPDHRQWGPKTRRYADEVGRRTQQAMPPPQVGQIVDNHEYIGGDPNNPRSWRRAR